MELSNFKNKKILILGLGLHGGGAGAAKFFSRLGSKVVITDLKSRRELAASISELKNFKNISYVLGRHRIKDVVEADLIIKNPGVPNNLPLLKTARANHVPIASDVEIFLKLCPAPVIGITGTKGKSTTAWLLAEFLRRGLKKGRVFLGGNIRKSVLEILPAIRTGDVAVLELSSFQLDSLAPSRIAPKFAVITNIYPEHLNRYRSFAHYAKSKTTIFRFQKKTDYLFINKYDGLVRKISKKAPSKRILVDVKRLVMPFSAELNKRYAPYQRLSIALAIAVARHFGVSKKNIAGVLKRAKQLPGRLETTAKIGGVTFINDTTATNPEAAQAALETLSKKFKNIILIAGGASKNLPSASFARAITKFAKAVIFLPGSATADMKLKVENEKSKVVVLDAKSMPEAVKLAYALAAKGDAVLLSPGAASFGLFKHEFDRGEQFVAAVKKLK